jgi:hypothetical protein
MDELEVYAAARFFNRFPWKDEAGVKWEVTLGWGIVNGRYEAVEVRIIGPGRQRAVTSETLRRIPLGKFVRENRKRQQAEREGLQGKARDRRTKNFWRDDTMRWGGQRGVALTVEDLREVARVYGEARAWGDPVTKAVAERFKISESTAAKRIMRARRAGFIDGGKR